MREIRYNAWDKYFKTMCRVNAIDFSLKTARLLPVGSCDPKSIYETSLDNLVLLQHTGIEDSQGEEIIEGDIVKCSDDGDPIVCYVKWHGADGYPAFDLHPHIEMCSNNLSHFRATGSIEVIGNIYEHHELMNESGIKL